VRNGGGGGGALDGLNRSGERKEREKRASPPQLRGREKGGSSRARRTRLKAIGNDVCPVEASGDRARCPPEQGSGAMENRSAQSNSSVFYLFKTIQTSLN
jgi:hypothetical protein